MKKTLLKTTAGILTAALLVTGLAGCGSAKEDKEAGSAVTEDAAADPAKAQDGETADSGETTADPENPWMIGDPDDPIELTIFLNHTWYPIEEFKGIIPDEITRRTGIRLVPTKATDASQLGVLASSGELPDLVFTSTMLDILSDPEICYSYNELIDEYNVDWDIDEGHIINAKAFSPDDNYYFIFSHASTNKDWAKSSGVPMVGSMLYRYDMLEELGNPEINNLDDLDRVFGMVKEKWPDVTPLVFNVDTWWLEPFKTWNGCTLQDFIINDNDQCEIVAKTEPFKQYLSYCNNMYRKGYINADNFSWNTSDMVSAFGSGKAFASIGNTQTGNRPPTGSGSYLQMLQEVAPNAQLREMKPLSDYPLINSEVGWCGTFITKNNKNVEASIRFLQFMYSEEGQKLSQWGREGSEYVIDENGVPVFSEEWKKANEEGKLNEIYCTNFHLGGSKILEAESRCAIEGEEFVESNKAIRESYTNEPWYVYSAPKTSDGDYKVIYDQMVDLVRSAQAKIILSEDDSEFEKNYNEFIEQLNKIGVDRLAEYMTPKLVEARDMFLAAE